MKKISSVLLTIILATVLAASLFFMTTRSMSGSIETGAIELEEYDLWCDVNNDGKIDVFDAVMVIGRIPSQGQNLTKAALTYDSEWYNITDKAGRYFNITHSLNTTEIMVDIQGKSIMGGGVHQQHLGLTGYTPGWSKPYGGQGSDRASSVIHSSDGGYALAGYTYSFGSGGDFYLVKTDANGVLQWNNTYGGTSPEQAYSMVQTGDGGYALAGYTMSFGADGRNFYLVKTDANGVLQWNNTYGGLDSEWAYSMVQTGDGGYALAGIKAYDGAETDDFWLVKTDANGNMQWNQTYGGPELDWANSVVQTGDGGYALAGYTRSFGAGSYDFYLVKTDVESGLAWTDSTPDTITLYRGVTDPNWNYVRVRIWKIREDP